jgi:F420-dependent oxidoreductase-like protein
MKVRSAHAFVGHNVPITIFRVDTAYYPIVNFGMSPHDLCHQPAHGLAHLMSDRAVSCREVIEAHLARIDAVNPALNALAGAADPGACLNAADDADDRVTRRDPPGKAPRRSRWAVIWRRSSAGAASFDRHGGRIESDAMRFGLFIPQGWRLDLVDIPTASQWGVMRDLATYADDGAWDSLWVYDHFHTVPQPTDEATHEAWSLMSAYAATTSRIKLGQMCTAMGYRNPVYLAKVAATADIISGGRVQMGIGGGWYQHEWEAYGYGFPSAGVRLGMLDEGVQIMRDAWRDGRVSFDGKHYQVNGAIVAPKPLQDGGLPLWIAGGGEKVTLKIAAKYAQYTNFTSEPDGFAHKSQVLADHCRNVGTDYDAIVRSANFNAVIGESDADVKERVARLRARLVGKANETAVDGMLGMATAPDAASGTPDQVVEKLKRMRELGCEYAILNFPEAAYDRSGIELFEQKVIPALS